MKAIYLLAVLLLGVSLGADRRRTRQALNVAVRRFAEAAPAFLAMLALVALVLSFVPDPVLAHALARNNRWLALGSAVGLGSIAVMPGFIAFPLCGILLEKGAPYFVLSAFSTTLMMVGIATFPLEKRYLGTRVALTRNLVGLLIALLVSIATGLIFGELP